MPSSDPARRYRDIPDCIAAIHEDVASMDFDRFVADPKTGHITHLVLTRGHLWGKNNVLIPLNVIDNFENDQVVLKIDKHAVGELPKFAIKR